jgi:flagellar FliL protein
MAEEAEEAAEAKPADDKKKKKGSSKLVLILGVLVLLGGGAGAAWFLGLLRFGSKAANHEVAAEATPEPRPGGEHGPGPMLALDPFIANLADQSGSRYLKATFQLEFSGKTVPEGFEARSPQIRDLLLTLLTSKTFDEIRTPEGKQDLREEIIRRVNQTLDRDVVKAVYFTEFIVQ